MLKFHRLGILTFRQVSFLIVKQYKQINQGVSFPDFLGIPVYVATVYLSGTKEPSPWVLITKRALSIKFSEFKLSRLA